MKLKYNIELDINSQDFGKGLSQYYYLQIYAKKLSYGLDDIVNNIKIEGIIEL